MASENMMLKTLAIFIGLTLTAGNTSAQFKDRIKLFLSSEIPVEVLIQNVSQTTYLSDLDQPVYSIDFSITNRSDSILGQVSFIEYSVNKDRKVVGTTFWSERDSILPNETRQFSTLSSFGDYKNLIGIWNVTEICTEFGSMQLDLRGVKRSVDAFIVGKVLPLPRAQGSLFPKCRPE